MLPLARAEALLLSRRPLCYSETRSVYTCIYLSHLETPPESAARPTQSHFTPGASRHPSWRKPSYPTAVSLLPLRDHRLQRRRDTALTRDPPSHLGSAPHPLLSPRLPVKASPDVKPSPPPTPRLPVAGPAGTPCHFPTVRFLTANIKQVFLFPRGGSRDRKFDSSYAD